jgi:Mrp family chromosome partitioning ATPase
MRRGRGGLPMLGEIGGPPAENRAWSLCRRDAEALEAVRKRLDGISAVLVLGAAAPSRVLAVGLAGVAAAAGRRTVLLDCDLEHSALAGAVGLDQAPGLHEYLRWEATPQDVLRPLVLAGPASPIAAEPLAFIPAGRPTADPATLLGLPSFRHMSAKLRHGYELVVVAGPPLDAAEAALTAVAAESDCALAGIDSAQRTRRRRRALGAALRGFGADPLGAVVVQRS